MNKTKADQRQPVFKPWQPIATAPKDGTEIEGRGYNWGDRTRGMHRLIVYWNGTEWRDAHDEDSTLNYLIEWREYDGQRN